MSTEELIRYLRTVADYGTELTKNDKEAFAQAADRLEELEERVAIMMEGDNSDLQGDWEYVGGFVSEQMEVHEFRCSVCDSPQTFYVPIAHYLFCPMCGTKMRFRTIDDIKGHAKAMEGSQATMEEIIHEE